MLPDISFFTLLGANCALEKGRPQFFSAMQKYETGQSVNKMLNLRRIRLHSNFKRFQ